MSLTHLRPLNALQQPLRAGRQARTHPTRLLAFLAGLWVAAVAVAWIAQHWLGMGLRPAGAGAWLWVLLGAPVLEESVFRPLVQSSLHEGLQRWRPPLRSRFWPRPAAVQAVVRRWAAEHGATVLTTIAFAAAHAPAHGWHCLWWLLPGLALAEVWHRSGSLCACIATHAWFNLSLALLSRGL
ncbi:CPBP family intramembrane metalloprotease [Acidovorax sp. 1608163]|uniref:CPBP family glutamic-type intramembrane protease n=1 Tax=Acidovorax sp. 1608163 TaxID=2478662 RepID=UPI000EF738A1|nr:CPBP family glutamic-type intramembrane protease [Acidovorax sp. 1608163]AYM97930.1 CPBP family intramembrane metalloprotease [Acidovorax sp. 1608163]